MFQCRLVCRTLISRDRFLRTVELDHDRSVFYSCLKNLDGGTTRKKPPTSSLDGGFRGLSVLSKCTGIGNAPVEHNPVALGHDSSTHNLGSLHLCRMPGVETRSAVIRTYQTIGDLDAFLAPPY